MHVSSRLKAEAFLAHYGGEIPHADGVRRVLDIGAKSYGGHGADDTYRPLFDDRFRYVGMDIEAGDNVDLVQGEGYLWPAIPNQSFDLCISGQTFEHNPFFWITTAEIARVLSPGGLALIIAPGASLVHRFPYDCWRFYPDAWAALCAMTGLELVESYFESDATAFVVPGGNWRDSVMVARKPVLGAAESQAFHARLDAITAPFRDRAFSIGNGAKSGPCFQAYERSVFETYGRGHAKALKFAIQGRPKARLFRG